MDSLVDSILFPSEELQLCSQANKELVIVTNHRIICLLRAQWSVLYRKIIKNWTISPTCVSLDRFDLVETKIDFEKHEQNKLLSETLDRTQHLCGQSAFVLYNSEHKVFKTRREWMKGITALFEGVPDIMRKEINRLGFEVDSGNNWRISTVNKDFSMCPTYPPTLLCPADMTDLQLTEMADFRKKMRIPSVVWRCSWNGAVLMRCSQPQYGIIGRRCPEDELFISRVSEMCENGIKIADCRSYMAATANRTRGGGVEFPEYYNFPVFFLNIPNIHKVRSYGDDLKTDCSHSQRNNGSPLETTKWMECIRNILSSGNECVGEVIDFSRSLLIHCSDGWDRTAQISSLVQIQLDPYYRSILGFQVLVEKEWVAHGHCFATRCGGEEDSPVFVQWIECVYQLMIQFPNYFEFNEAFLIRLIQHSYSTLFGDFLANSAKERQESGIDEKTFCLWSYLSPEDPSFVNPTYSPCPASLKNVLLSNQHDLKFWKRLHFDWSRTLDITSRHLQVGDLVKLPFKFEMDETDDFSLFLDVDGLPCFEYTPTVIETKSSLFSANQTLELIDSDDSILSVSDIDSAELSSNHGIVCHLCTRLIESNIRHCCMCGFCVCSQCVVSRWFFYNTHRLICIKCGSL